MHCSGDVVPSDMKMHSNSSPMKFYRSMYRLVTLAKGHLPVIYEHFQ